MKRVYYFLLLAIAILGSSQLASAHAVWLESAPRGIPAKEHTVRVYFGEYATKEFDKTADWYSDLRDLEVSVLQPDQSHVKLSLVDKGSHLEATFIPQQNGTYFVSTSHATKELGGTMRYEFTSQVAIQVGKEAALAGSGALPYQLITSPQEYAIGDQVEVFLLKDGTALPEQDVLVMSPSGWSKHYKSDAQGKVVIETLWKGIYVVEFGHTTKVDSTWHGNPYTENWQGITTSFPVE